MFKLLCRESESGLINCCIDGVRESLPFDVNNFEMRGGFQYGDLVINRDYLHVLACLLRGYLHVKTCTGAS